MKIRFIPPARRELIEEARYYDGLLRGLGDAFLDEVSNALALIKAHPEAWPLDQLDCTRRLIMARFPFAIVYLLDGDNAVVIAIAHAKRRPRYWRSRVMNPSDGED